MKQKLLTGGARLVGFVVLFVAGDLWQRAAEQQAQMTYDYWPVVFVPVFLSLLWAVYFRTLAAPEFWQWVGQKEKKKLAFSAQSLLTGLAVLFLFLLLRYNTLLTFTGASADLLAYLLIWYFLLGSIRFELKENS
ncbi:hypothetical protein SDC9_158053 [bioreactor metagenome]|uniref:Uncharacterized protein n=1 Tax=bioreactor metagenome TaxID=1076179 RepID=A0A645FAX2_9ZZZZ